MLVALCERGIHERKWVTWIGLALGLALFQQWEADSIAPLPVVKHQDFGAHYRRVNCFVELSRTLSGAPSRYKP